MVPHSVNQILNIDCLKHPKGLYTRNAFFHAINYHVINIFQTADWALFFHTEREYHTAKRRPLYYSGQSRFF